MGAIKQTPHIDTHLYRCGVLFVSIPDLNIFRWRKRCKSEMLYSKVVAALSKFILWLYSAVANK